MRNTFHTLFGRGALCLVAGAALASAAFTGCVRDAASEFTPEPVRAGELRMAFTVDDMSETRAVAAEPHERKLSDVHILFFDQPGNYITYQHATVPVGSSYFSFPVPQELTANTAYRTLVIGNAHDHVPDNYRTFDEYLTHVAANGSYETIRSDLYASLNSAHHDVGSGTAVLPMWGEVQDPLGQACDFSFSGNNSTGYTISERLRFWRSVCRLDLQHLAAKQLIITRVKLVNFRKGGYYFHQDVPFAPASGSQLGGINDGTWIEVAAPSVPSGAETYQTQEVKGKIYAFPNMVPVVVQNDALTTYLMIEGYYQDGTDNTTANPRNKLTYYRFNMAENGRAQILRRNHCYKGIINRVSGPGAPSEGEAEDATAPLLDYSVSDTWQEDGNTTVSDSKGNFLTISRAMVSFAGEADLSETVKIQVKEGLSWSVAWDHAAADAADYAYFSFSRNDDVSFAIRTRQDNSTDFLRKARLTVTATGGTVDSASPLTAVIDVMQLSSKDEVKVLMVDNNVGTLTQRVPGVGGTLRMQVQTGSKRSTWVVRDEDNSAASLGVAWTESGADGGGVEVEVPANVSDNERTFSLKVTRLDNSGAVDNEIPPVIIAFTQPKSDYLLTVTPSVPGGQDGLSINGFDPTVTTLKSGLSVQKKFTVNLADPTHYKYCVKSTFNKDYDLFLTKDAPADNTKVVAQWTANSSCVDTLSNLNSGQSFYINVFRTGPGDPTIRGTIKIYAVPADPAASDMESQVLAMTVSIKTPCVVNDALIKNGSNAYLLIPDRNVGAPMRVQNGKFVSALYFTNDTNVNITGSQGPDSNNNDWKGEYYPWTTGGGKTGAGQAGFVTQYWLVGDTEGNTNMDEEGIFSPWYKTADAAKWVVPTQAHLNTINAALIFSKQRAFVVSEAKDKISGNYIGCFFPLAGNGRYPAYVDGYYWSATASNIDYAYYLGVTPTGSSVTGSSKTYLYSVRCVRSVTADEFNSAQ